MAMQVAEAAAVATSSAAAMQQAAAGTTSGYAAADSQANALAQGPISGVDAGSLESHLAARNRRATGNREAAAAGKAGAGGGDDWGEEPLGEDLLPM